MERMAKLKIIFKPLQETHFVLLLKWLEAPHVKVWWDSDVAWTLELIYKKYDDYVKGYKFEEGISRALYSFIIEVAGKPIGYIQCYNIHDFLTPFSVEELPKSLGAVDMFIGEVDYLGRGIGNQALELFLEKICKDKYEYVCVDPHSDNEIALKVYKRAGFKEIAREGDTILMIKKLWRTQN